MASYEMMFKFTYVEQTSNFISVWLRHNSIEFSNNFHQNWLYKLWNEFTANNKL